MLYAGHFDKIITHEFNSDKSLVTCRTVPVQRGDAGKATQPTSSCSFHYMDPRALLLRHRQNVDSVDDPFYNERDKAGRKRMKPMPGFRKSQRNLHM
jgi:hypothetical protein